MCNYIIQNIIFLVIIFLYMYIILDFRFKKENFDFKNYIKKRKKQSTLSMFMDINGWQAVIASLVFTIIYFFLGRGVLSDILSIFNVDLC